MRKYVFPKRRNKGYRKYPFRQGYKPSKGFRSIVPSSERKGYGLGRKPGSMGHLRKVADAPLWLKRNHSAAKRGKRSSAIRTAGTGRAWYKKRIRTRTW